MGFGIAEIKTWALARLTAAQRAAGAVGPAGVTAAGGLVDASGAVVPTGGVSATLASGSGAAAANTALIQAGILGGGELSIVGAGLRYINETLFLDSDTQIKLDPQITLASEGAARITLATTLNVVYGPASMAGVALICATDGTTPGTGNVRRLTSPHRLFYTAPGDAEGPAVDVSGLVSGAGRVTLASSNGQKLHVAVTLAGLTGNTTSGIKIGANKGSVQVTWARTSNVTTITETAHGRRPGDAVVLFGTGLQAQVYVDTVAANTWTFADSRANGSGTGEAFGKRNIHVTGAGTLDYGMSRGTTPRHITDAHTLIFVGCSDWSVDGPLLLDGYKYGIYGQCVSRYKCDVRGYADNPTSSTAIVQINGKSRGARIRATGTSTDTATALIGGDFPTQTFLFPNDEGGLDFDDTLIHDLDLDECHFDVVRLAGAAGIWYRNTRVYNVRAKVVVGASQIVGLILDPGIYLGTETNVAGLEIDGLFVAKSGATDTAYVRLVNGGSQVSSGVRISRLELSYASEANGLGPVRIDGGSWRDVVVDGAYQRNPTWQGALVSTSSSAAATVQHLAIRNCHLRIDNALKNTAWRSTLLTTNNANCTIQSLSVEDCSMVDVSAAGTKATPVAHFSGSILDWSVQRLRLDGTLDVAYNNVSNPTARVMLRDIDTNNVSYVLRLDAPVGEVHIGAMRHLTNVVDAIRIGYSSATVRVRSLGGMPSTAPTSGQHVNVAGGTANAPDCDGADLLVNTATIAAITGRLVRTQATGRVQTYDGSAWVNV